MIWSIDRRTLAPVVLMLTCTDGIRPSEDLSGALLPLAEASCILRHN